MSASSEIPPLSKQASRFTASWIFWIIIAGLILMGAVVFGSQIKHTISSNASPMPVEVTATTTPLFQSVTLGGQPYFLEVANTTATRAQGLSDRLGLLPDTGMRFIFDAPASYSFWMHNMHFPLDMVFLNAGKIVYIANGVPEPKTATEEPATVHPQQAFTDVLELSAGEASRLGLKLGQHIDLP